jgi:hypothetical protein
VLEEWVALTAEEKEEIYRGFLSGENEADARLIVLDLTEETPDEVTHQDIRARSIQSCTRTVLPGELAKHAVSEGTKAVVKFMSQPRPQDAAGHSTQANLQFPVSLVCLLSPPPSPEAALL